MKEAKLTRAERYALMLYRQGKEKSRALPVRAYRDPSTYVEFDRSKRRERAEVERVQLANSSKNKG